MQNNIFFIFLLICSLFPCFYQTTVLNYTTSEIINFDLTQIHDCISLNDFKDQLNAARTITYQNDDVLENANSTIIEAQVLINKIILLENSRTNPSSFAMKSQNALKNKRLRKGFSKRSQNFLEVNQDKIKFCLKGLDNVYDLVSADCQKNIKKLNDLFILVSSKQSNKSPVEICEEVLTLLDKINDSLNQNIQEIKKTISDLEDKQANLIDLTSSLNC